MSSGVMPRIDAMFSRRSRSCAREVTGLSVINVSQRSNAIARIMSVRILSAGGLKGWERRISPCTGSSVAHML